EAHESPGAEAWLEVPSFVVELLREIAGDAGRVSNATALFMNPVDGLRTANEVEQLAAFEFSATYASQAVRNVLFGLQPGMTEFEAVQLMRLPGLPHAVHLMLSSGERAHMGLPSPSAKRIEPGERFTMAVGLWGALTARAGFVVHE